MMELEDTEQTPEGEGAEPEHPESRAPRYDPLFSTWESGPAEEETSAFDPDDVVWLTGGEWRPPLFERMSAEDAFGQVPARQAGAPWSDGYERAVARLQQLPERAMSVPRPSRRSQGIQVALIGLALLSVGGFAAASGLQDVPWAVVVASYAALVVGGSLVFAGVGAAALDLPLPLPGVVTVRELAETLLLAVLIFLAVRASFQNFKVEGASMQPSLQNGEYLIVNKLTYAELDLSIFNFLPFVDVGNDEAHHLWDAPSRGDVIVFRAPTSPNRDFIKRVIGEPGDTLEITEATGQVAVNGSMLMEPYTQGTTNCNISCKWKIPAANTEESRTQCGSNACYFVMGDNRQNSSDSRQGWLVPEENIIGKALITYWNEGQLNVKLAPNHSVGVTNQAQAKE